MNGHDYSIGTHRGYPTKAELDLFYADEYYENLKDRAPDLDKFMAADNAEINWLSGTLWNDIDEILSHVMLLTNSVLVSFWSLLNILIMSLEQ
jgi:hypothetical protein